MRRKFKVWQSWLITICLLVVLLASGWIVYNYALFKSREFTLLKPWATADQPVFTAEGFVWAHRQCRQNLVKASTTGLIKPWLASDVRVVNQRTWRLTLRDDLRWSDDGSPVKSFDFVATWRFRKEGVAAEDLGRIKSMTSMDDRTLDIELAGDLDAELDLSVMNSLWLTAVKNPEGKWTWEQELSAPCYGPFVTKSISKDFIKFKRNPKWAANNEDLVQVVRLILQNPSDPEGEKIIRSGGVSFAIHPGFDPQPDSKKLFVTRSSIEPMAFYMLINPKGVFNGKTMAFPHLSINRAELSGTITNSLYFNVMYRILPLTFMNEDDGKLLSYFPNFNLESHLDARRLIGLKDDMPSDRIKFPPHRNLRLAVPDDQRLIPIVERYAARLKANYNIDTDIFKIGDNGLSLDSADLILLAVDLDGGVDVWARDFIAELRQMFGASAEIVAKLEKLASGKSDEMTIGAMVSILKGIDEMAPEKSNIVPLGQFGTRFIVDGDVLDVVITGDKRQDPDISRARWVKGE